MKARFGTDPLVAFVHPGVSVSAELLDVEAEPCTQVPALRKLPGALSGP